MSDDDSVSERCTQMAELLGKLRKFADGDDSARIGRLLEAVSPNTANLLS